MEQFTTIYSYYISPGIIALLIIVALIAFFYLVRFLIQVYSLGRIIEECLATSSRVHHQIELSVVKKTVVSSYYRKKKAQFSFLVSSLFLLHIVNDKD